MHDIVLYARGAYRVVHDDDDRPRPYVVIDTAGTPLYEDAGFDGARAWLDRREALDHAPPTPAARRGRAR